MHRAAALAAVLFFGGCSLITGPSELERLDDARARWALRGYEAYSYEVVRSCFCGYPAGARIRVLVDRGVVVAAWDAETDEAMPSGLLPSFPTVEGLFGLAQEMIEGADEYRVRYDAELGYPRELFADWIARAVDDELHVTARDLIPDGLGTGTTR